MPTNTLTDARCKGAKPADKPYKLFDGGGLFLGEMDKIGVFFETQRSNG